MRQPHDYKHIAAWGKFLRSDYHYIREEQEAAARQNAPLDAIYRKRDEQGFNSREWATYDSVTNSDTRYTVDQILAGMNG